MTIRGRYSLGIICFACLVRAAPVEDTLRLARRALQNEGVATAWKLSQKALAEAPDSAAAHEFAGEVLFRRGEFAPAESEFQQAVKLDAALARGWWGLARIAECTSMHKTARQYFRHAHELDPGDPRIFVDWAMRLPGRQHIEALDRYLAMVDPNRDADEVQALRQHVELDRALDGRKLMALASAYENVVIPLLPFVNDGTHMRTYGLEVSINNVKVKLQLDTGAGGIMIQRKAADRAGVTRLAEATFHGFGNNAKLPGGYRGVAERVRIGEVEFHNALTSVTDGEISANADGLIGTDVFDDFLIGLDFAGGTLRLAPLPDHRPGDEEPHDRSVPPGMQDSARVFRFGHLLLIPTRVSESREVLFVLDTGAARTLISYDMAAEVSKIKRDDKMRVQGINGKVTDVYQTGDVYLQFAGFRQKSLGMTTFDMWNQSRSLGTQVSGFLGLPLLSMFQLTIDYRDGLVYFEYKNR